MPGSSGPHSHDSNEGEYHRTSPATVGLWLLIRHACLKQPLYNAFSSAVQAIWNNLPISVIEANSLPVFRRRLKTHLFTVAFEASGQL